MNKYSTELDAWIDHMHGDAFHPAKLDTAAEAKLKEFVAVTDKFEPIDRKGERFSFYITETTPTLEQFMESQREGS